MFAVGLSLLPNTPFGENLPPPTKSLYPTCGRKVPSKAQCDRFPGPVQFWRCLSGQPQEIVAELYPARNVAESYLSGNAVSFGGRIAQYTFSIGV